MASTKRVLGGGVEPGARRRMRIDDAARRRTRRCIGVCEPPVDGRLGPPPYWRPPRVTWLVMTVDVSAPKRKTKMPWNSPPVLFTVDEFVATKSTQLVQSDGTMRKLQIPKLRSNFVTGSRTVVDRSFPAELAHSRESARTFLKISIRLTRRASCQNTSRAPRIRPAGDAETPLACTPKPHRAFSRPERARACPISAVSEPR